jgi:Fe-S cluster assembly protein SufD
MSIQVSSVPNSLGTSTGTKNRELYLAQLLELAKQSQPSLSLDWLQEIRHQAAVWVQEQTFPTTRDEEWRFTDLSPLLGVDLAAIGDQQLALSLADISDFILPEAANHRLVFVNGVYAAELSTVPVAKPTNVDLYPASELLVGNLSALPASYIGRLQTHLRKQLASEDVFAALNTAGLTDLAVIWVPKNLTVEMPVHLVFITTTEGTALFSQPRCLVVAEPNSALTLVEEHVAWGEGTYFTNSVTEVWLEENAQVNHVQIQRDRPDSFHIGKTAVSQGRHSRYTCHAISLGAKLSRHHLDVHSMGEQTETTLNGLTLIGDEQVADTHSAIAFTKPYSTSRQLHKCIVGDRAHAIFNGKVFVPKAAQLTDAGQLNHTLLLSPKARVDTKPQLEIVADNVKCTHGATVGQLDTDEIFYLRSRGIDADSARNLLIYAFAYEILEQIPVDSLKQTLSQLVNSQTPLQ